MESLADRTLAANMTSFHVPHVEKNNKKTSKNKKRWTRVFIIIAERDISLFAYLCWISVVERCVCGAPIVQLTRTMPLTMVVLCYNFHTRHILAPDSRGINKRVVVARAECTDTGVNV